MVVNTVNKSMGMGGYGSYGSEHSGLLGSGLCGGRYAIKTRANCDG